MVLVYALVVRVKVGWWFGLRMLFSGSLCHLLISGVVNDHLSADRDGLLCQVLLRLCLRMSKGIAAGWGSRTKCVT